MRKDALSSKPLSGYAASQSIRVLITVACLAIWSVQTAQAQQQITDRWSRMAAMNDVKVAQARLPQSMRR